MLRTMYLSLGQHYWFWKARSRFFRVVFYLHKNVFGIKDRFEAGKAESRIFVDLAASTLKSLLISLAFVGLLVFINPFAASFFEKFGLQMNEGPYAHLLATIAAIGGVLIGLYYAAITSIAGAIYANLPNNVRNVFAQERVGNLYMRFLSALTFSTVALLGLNAAGFHPNMLGLLVLSIGTGISIVAFVKLGARAFNLFDPSVLAGELVYRVLESYARVTPRHYRWSDPSWRRPLQRR